MKGDEVKLIVTVPEITPEEDTIYIVGSHKLMGEWDPGKIPLTKVEKNKWEFETPLDEKIYLEYKITRGSWVNEAIYKEEQFPRNQILKVDNNKTVEINIVGWQDLTPIEIKSEIIGTVKYHENFHSEKLNNDRTLIVLLPKSYDSETGKRYPVLYMHDGQNIIDPLTAYTRIDWQVDETIDKLVSEGKMKKIIVVGIYNTKDRLFEYGNTSKGSDYMNFIVNEVKPFIDKTYRTLPDRKNTATMGSSMGGLISFLLVWKHSDVFSMAGCLSSSLPMGGLKNFLMVEKSNAPEDVKIYLDHGDVSGERRLVRTNQLMRDLLIKRGFVLGKNLIYNYEEGADHSESAWAERVWKPLLFMFGKDGYNKFEYSELTIINEQ
jgi:predicted alpha/beta superfamily hydrolase